MNAEQRNGGDAETNAMWTAAREGVATGVLVAVASAGSGFDPGNFVGFLFGLLQNFAAAIINGISNLFTTVLQGFGQGLVLMFAGWGSALGAYGIWGPVMVVVSLGAAAFIFHLMLDVIGVEKDISQVESAL